ncbi:MAG TPA: hypothetical protein VJ728_17010 [Candidatus Binataceae bacterium]|nr:hypothetical protein [Candidatus Binataceae bacterium]
MADLTISVDDATLAKARLRAAKEETSVNEILRNFLDSYAGLKAEQAAALRDLLEIARQARSQSVGKRWTRDELYERE